MKQCTNCGEQATHEHHIVPKSKGGVVTVPLCVFCHSQVHEKKMASTYLTRLALFKKDMPLFCRLFYLITCEEMEIKDIANNMEVKEHRVRNLINRMKQIHFDDLMLAFKPIIDYSTNSVFNEQYVEEKWEEYIS